MAPSSLVSSVQPIEGFGAMASHSFSTPTKDRTAQRPVVTDPQPMLRQLSLRAWLQQDPPETPVPPARPKRQYRARGTAGTFRGKRPPKALHRRAAFEKQRAAHLAELNEKKATKSNYKPSAYHKFVKEMLPLETGGSSRDRFRRVAQKWRSQQAGQSAAMADETKRQGMDESRVADNVPR